jgi:hypothetical protein
MVEIPNLSIQEIDLIQNLRMSARDDLQNALLMHWHELGNLNDRERSEAGRFRVIQFMGAYVDSTLAVEAEIYVRSKWDADDLSGRLDELASRVWNEVMPPRFYLNAGFYLGDLHYDDAYRSHITNVIQDQIRLIKNKHVPQAKGPDDSSPREILDGYQKRERVTNKQLAQIARVDESVIYAIKAGRKKYGPEALSRVAAVVGCEPSRLVPNN